MGLLLDSIEQWLLETKSMRLMLQLNDSEALTPRLSRTQPSSSLATIHVDLCMQSALHVFEVAVSLLPLPTVVVLHSSYFGRTTVIRLMQLQH